MQTNSNNMASHNSQRKKTEAPEFLSIIHKLSKLHKRDKAFLSEIEILLQRLGFQA